MITFWYDILPLIVVTSMWSHAKLLHFAPKINSFHLPSKCNAPATFSTMMEMVLSDLVRKLCLIYLDHVIAFGVSDGTLESLWAVFAYLWTHNLLSLRLRKCEFFQMEVDYLRHEESSHFLGLPAFTTISFHSWQRRQREGPKGNGSQ